MSWNIVTYCKADCILQGNVATYSGCGWISNHRFIWNLLQIGIGERILKIDKCIWCTYDKNYGLLFTSHSVKGLKGVSPSQSYRESPVIWADTLLPATQHRWTCPALTPARQADLPTLDPVGMEGWVDMVGWLWTEMVYLPRLTRRRRRFRIDS